MLFMLDQRKIIRCLVSLNVHEYNEYLDTIELPCKIQTKYGTHLPSFLLISQDTISTTNSMNYEQFINPHNKVFLVNMKEDKPTAMFSSLAQTTLETYLPKGKRVLIIGGKK